MVVMSDAICRAIAFQRSGERVAGKCRGARVCTAEFSFLVDPESARPRTETPETAF